MFLRIVSKYTETLILENNGQNMNPFKNEMLEHKVKLNFAANNGCGYGENENLALGFKKT